MVEVVQRGPTPAEDQANLKKTETLVSQTSAALFDDVFGKNGLGVKNLGAKAEAKAGELLAFAAPVPKAAPPAPGGPGAYSIIPPYMLNEIATRTKIQHFTDTLNATNALHAAGGVQPHTGTDFKGFREVYDAKGKEVHPGKLVRDDDKHKRKSGNADVDNAFDFTGQVRDFYKDAYGRNSIDDKGMKYISTVNYGKNYENAFWNGSQMTYGKPSKDSPFATFMLLDVCGHEITHGVTGKESSLTYYGQAGALNESISDVFGELIKQRAAKQTADKADWVVGSGIWKSTVAGRGLRDMLHPGTAYDDPKVGKDPQPDNMKNYKKMTGDNGGVHYNSGIPNRAFAEFAVAVGGNAWEDPGHIWFAARKAAGSNPSFAQFAYQTIEEAKKPGYKVDVKKLETAWANVGVTPSATATDTDTPAANTSKPKPKPPPKEGDDSSANDAGKRRGAA